MADLENMTGKADHEKEDLPVESLEVFELEDGDLDAVSGGTSPVPQTNTNCSGCTNVQCPPSSSGGGGN